MAGCHLVTARRDHHVISVAVIVARVMTGPASLRRFMIQNFIREAAGMQQVLQDEQMLEAYVRRATVGVWHCSCSCRMGSEDDPMAVTSPSGMVRGMPGLRVVDASIFPMIPCANTNLPTMMVAEKIADDILAGSSVAPSEGHAMRRPLSHEP